MTLKVAYCAGHSKYDTPGKETPDGEKEWVFNDKVTRAFAAELSKYEGVELRRFDDPTGKIDIPLDDRTDGANAWGADIYISFHHNAFKGVYGTHTGTVTFIYTYPNPNSVKLANLVHPALIKAYGLRDRGIKKANFHIVREAKCPSILLEGGFMDSSIDIVKLRDDNVLKNAGIGVAEAVAEYGNLKKKIVQPISSDTYTVQVGDTLWGIANKYKMSVAELKSLNNLSSDIIHPGQKLKLKQTSTQSNSIYIVKSGDSLWKIASENDISVNELKKLNGLTSDIIHPGDKLKLTSDAKVEEKPTPQPKPVPQPKPAPKGDMQTTSIVTYLNSIDVDSSFANRTKLAKQYGITNYAGTAAQNLALLHKMRNGNAPVAEKKLVIKEGAKVTLKTSASTYATGEKIPSFVKGKTYTILQVGNGKVLLKEIFSWVRISDLS